MQFVMDKTRNEIKYIFSGHYCDQCGSFKGGDELPVLATYVKSTKEGGAVQSAVIKNCCYDSFN